MFKMKKLCMTFSLLVSSALFIYGCGGGGGGGGGTTPTPGTASKSAAAASKAIVGALDAASIASGGTASGGTDSGGTLALKLSLKPAAPLSDAAQVRQSLQVFNASIHTRQQKVLQTVTDTGNQACKDGGTRRVQTNDNNTPLDVTDDSFSITTVDCIENGVGFTSFTNGSFSLAPTAGGFLTTFNQFTFRGTGSGGTFESILNGTMSFSGTNVPCGVTSFLESGSFTMNFTGTFKEDLDNNGSFEVNQSFAMNNVTMSMTETHTAAPVCTPGTATFTLNGEISSTDHVDGLNTFSATFTQFTTTMTPAVRNGVEGDLLSLSGTIAISSSCANGTFTLSTPAGAEPFIPVDDSCPVSGRFLVTGGGTTTAVIFTPAGGIQIDEGNNGSIEQTFADCEDAEACTS